MKLLWLVLLSFFAYGSAVDAGMVIQMFSNDAPTYLVDEDFEGTGLPTDWVVNAGSPDWDNTTRILSGSKSLMLDFGDDVSTPTFDVGSSTTHVKGMFGIDVIDNGDRAYMIVLKDVTETTICLLNIDSGDTLDARHGSVDGIMSSVNITDDFTFWIDYTPGTGANGVVDIYLSDDGTKPGTPTGSITNGTATTYPTKLQLKLTGTDPTGDVYYDNILVDDEVIP